MATTVVEHCLIFPSATAAAEQRLPLVYFDILWLPFPPMQNLFFYNFPSSKPHFFNTILPKLKNSLSRALKHFLPLAGKIILPLHSDSGTPVSRYAAEEDGVSLTIAASDSDFFLLTGNHPKDADDFHHFIPEISPAEYSPESIKFPVMALQITLFPEQGICIGIANHHAIMDGAGTVSFLHTWACINKVNDESHLRKILPVYDRTAVQDSGKLTPLIWEIMKNYTPSLSSSISFPTHKLRATFTLTDVEILKLKSFLKFKKPGAAHVSSYVAVCARAWICMAGASAAAAGEKVNDDDTEYLSMPADCRRRLQPPLPSNYFGNCLVSVLAESTGCKLRGENGFVVAAEAIGEAINKSFKNEKGIVDDYIENVVELMKKLNGGRVMVVAGSIGFDLCGIDYGFGEMKKVEALHINNVSIWICKTGDGVEVGVCMEKTKMDAFAFLFNKSVWDCELITSNL